jgi:hypothetical protein
MANPFFDAAYYLARNPDVAAAGYTLATAEQHYLRYGATESLTVASRAPNAWFDAKVYLAAYPDLVANGVTAATALSHYVTYGINENRSPAVNVNPADFSYATYAAANLDLRTAFGITDPAHLTALQQHQLLAQYLSYGVHEGRSGAAGTAAGSFFTPPATPGGGTPPVVPDDHGLVIDGTHASGIYIGTDLADNFSGTFQVPGASVDGTTVKGQLGIDTLTVTYTIAGEAHVAVDSIEHIAVNLLTNPGPPDLLTVAGTSVQSVSVTAQGNTFTYNGAHVGQFNLLDEGTTIANFTDVSASTDALSLTTPNGINETFTATGIEQYTIASTGGVLNLHADSIDGATLSAAISGGDQTFNFSTTGSNALTTVTVNAAAAVGNVNLQFDSSLAAANFNVSGGSGNDIVTSGANAQHSAILNGGDGNDTLVASAGDDTMAGGAGNDTFQFMTIIGATGLAKMNGPAIASTDVISDFTNGDTVTLSGVQATDTANFGGSIIASISTGVITFAAGYLAGQSGGLAAIVQDIDSQLNTRGFNQNVVFNDGIDTYFMQAASTVNSVSIVKLVGLAANVLTADALGVHFTPGPGI